jgi:hypothetical protein
MLDVAATILVPDKTNRKRGIESIVNCYFKNRMLLVFDGVKP